MRIRTIAFLLIAVASLFAPSAKIYVTEKYVVRPRQEAERVRVMADIMAGWDELPTTDTPIATTN